MSRLIKPSKKLSVKKSEAIVRARYRLSPLAIKFISVVISNLKRSDDINQEYVLRVKDFQELTGQKTKRIYELVDEALNDLLENPLTIPLGDEKNSILKANWVSGAVYNNGEIRFMIYPKLRPFLLDVKEKYLRYKLENILPLKSSYVIRLYEILKDWFELNKRYGQKAEKVVAVDDLREMLEIPTSYQYSSGIKKRILQKAKEEFAEYTDILFDFEEIRSGRKVTHVKFIIKPNPKKIEAKKSEAFENRRSFVKLLRQKYEGKRKFWGFNAIEGKNYWLGINKEGLMYGESDDGVLIHPDRFQSSNVYDLWFKVAQHSHLYRDLLQDGVDFRKLKQIDRSSWELFEEEIKRLKSEGLI